MTFVKNQYKIEKATAKITKMNGFQTIMAIVKGYIGIGVLGAPKAFANGGMGFTTIALILSSLLTSYCALKLIKVGNKMHCYSYSSIVKRSLG